MRAKLVFTCNAIWGRCRVRIGHIGQVGCSAHWPGWCFILGGLFFRWSDGLASLGVKLVVAGRTSVTERGSFVYRYGTIVRPHVVDGLMMAYILTVTFL